MVARVQLRRRFEDSRQCQLGLLKRIFFFPVCPLEYHSLQGLFGTPSLSKRLEATDDRTATRVDI